MIIKIVEIFSFSLIKKIHLKQLILKCLKFILYESKISINYSS